MIKKLASMLTMVMLLCQTCVFAETEKPLNNMHEKYENMTYEEYSAEEQPIHYFQDYPVTEIPDELYEVDTRGGVKMDLKNFDFTKDGSEFEWYNDSYIRMQHMKIGDRNAYLVTSPPELDDESKICGPLFPVKPNREYMISILIWSEFASFYTVESMWREFNIGVRFVDENGYMAQNRKFGMPYWSGEDGNGGWKRYEFIASAGPLENAVYGQPFFEVAQMFKNMPEAKIIIADLQVIELPEKPLEPYKEGEGVTFRGSAGDLDMKIEDAVQTENEIIVNTTGARYTFDLVNDTINAEQKINLVRTVSSWKSSVSFDGLKLKYFNEKEAVISNPEITFGVQMDGSVFLTPHNSDVSMLCTSGIAGQWNRFGSGFLLSYDDYGGFSVAPDIPRGSGRFVRTRVLTEDLDFTKMKFENNIEYYDAPKDWFISNAQPGWQIEWTISPGERLMIGTFPPREKDWKNYFNANWRNANPAPYYQNNMGFYADTLNIKNVIMWQSSNVTWAGNNTTPQYLHHISGGTALSILDQIRELGMKTLEYTSMLFYYDRTSPDNYMREVRRLKERADLDGIYSDGNPGEAEWIVSYEEARMLRELFPDGPIIVHCTGQPTNGGAPLSSTAFFLPNLDTYFSYTYKGELAPVSGYGAPMPAMTWPQHNLANCYGALKCDAWRVEEVKEDGSAGSLIDAHIASVINVIQGGIPDCGGDDFWINTVLPNNRKLERYWKEHGHEPYFYEEYFAPKVRELYDDFMDENVGVIDVLNHDFEDKVIDPKLPEVAGKDRTKENDGRTVLEGYSFSGIDATVVNNGKDGGKSLRLKNINNDGFGSMFKRTMSLSGEVYVSFDVKIEEAGNYEYHIYDDYGNSGITLRFSKDDKVKLKNGDNSYAVLSNFERNQWHNVSLNLNTDMHTYDVIIDGKTVLSKMPLEERFYYISNHEFMTNGNDSSMSLDNFKVSFEY